MLAPIRRYHVRVTHDVTAPAEPAFVAGDVLELQVFGADCIWVNQTKGKVLPAPPPAASIAPLDGTGTTAFQTVTLATTAPYEVTNEDKGFTGVAVTCNQAVVIAATLADLAVPARSVVRPAGVTFAISRAAGEPRVRPFFIKPAVAATLEILHTH